MNIFLRETKLSMESRNSLDRIFQLLKAIGNNLDSLSEFGETTPPENLKEDSVLVHNEIMVLWLNIILLFRANPGELKPCCMLFEISISLPLYKKY